MVSAPGAGAAGAELRTDGFAMRPASWQCVASLRYFTAVGNDVAGLAQVLGGALPGPLQAVRHGEAGSAEELVLCWRSPTETMFLCSAARLAALDAFAQSREDLCVVEQTGGICVWTLTGARVADVLLRAGSPEVIPTAGTARVGRLAELTVLTACVRAGEILAFVERVYQRHLVDWIRETVADL